MKSLKREKQCAKCPWRKDVDPYTIPDGYDVEKHRALADTIAAPGAYQPYLHAMACHESAVGDETYCIGWLMHQLGPGNNVALRLRMLEYDLSQVRTFGEQHACFEDTLPKVESRWRPDVMSTGRLIDTSNDREEK